MTDIDFEAQLALLRQDYANKLPQKLSEIETIWRNLLANNWQQSDRELLERALHSLAGSGKTFGFSDLSRVAKTAELMLNQTVDVFNAEECAIFEELLSRLKSGLLN